MTSFTDGSCSSFLTSLLTTSTTSPSHIDSWEYLKYFWVIIWLHFGHLTSSTTFLILLLDVGSSLGSSTLIGSSLISGIFSTGVFLTLGLALSLDFGLGSGSSSISFTGCSCFSIAGSGSLTSWTSGLLI